MPSNTRLASALVAAMSLQPGSAIFTVAQLCGSDSGSSANAGQPATANQLAARAVDIFMVTFMRTSPQSV